MGEYLIDWLIGLVRIAWPVLLVAVVVGVYIAYSIARGDK